jgi:N-formylglutamate amidohydrolase
MLLWRLSRGDSPLVVSVPHAGRHLPDAITLRMTSRARAVPDTDWHVDELYAFAPATGATLVAATHSRYVVDLNRDPSGMALYPGADNTELCPTRTFANENIYRPGESFRQHILNMPAFYPGRTLPLGNCFADFLKFHSLRQQ